MRLGNILHLCVLVTLGQIRAQSYDDDVDWPTSGLCSDRADCFLCTLNNCVWDGA